MVANGSKQIQLVQKLICNCNLEYHILTQEKYIFLIPAECLDQSAFSRAMDNQLFVV